MMLQNLYLIDEKKGLTATEIVERRLFDMPPGASILTTFDQKKSIERLAKKELLNFDGGPSIKQQKRKYYLSKAARTQIEQQIAQAESTVEKTIRSLFKNEQITFSLARDIFMGVVSNIFSELGEKYARTIIGDGEGEWSTSLDQQQIRMIASTAMSDEHSNYTSEVQRAVWRFFTDPNPLYTTLKWNLAQNFYVAKCLGLDKSGRILSSEIFRDAKLYLDTNIVFAAIDTHHSQTSTFKTLVDACRQLNIGLCVAHPTIEEFSRVVDSQARQIEKFGDKIPDATVSKIRNSVLDAWHQRTKSDPDVPVHEALREYFDPLSVLETYGVTLVDDKWFVSATRSPELQKLASAIANEYWRKRQKKKFQNAALHDAILLDWIERERQETHRPHWLVTFDTSLGEFEGERIAAGERSLAVTVDALIQWFSPMVKWDDGANKMADAFSGAIRAQLLPHDTFFELSDFRIFAGIDIETQNLPPEDVEGCVRYIRANAPTLDTTKAEDRERLTHEISRFFLNPARRYLSEISEMREEISTQTELNNSALAEVNSKLSTAEKENLDLKQSLANERARASLKLKLAGGVLLFCALTCWPLFAAYFYAEGDNYPQKLLSFWPFLCVSPIASIGLTALSLTKAERSMASINVRHLLKLPD